MCAASVGLCVQSGHAQVRIGQWNITNWSSTDVSSRGAAFQSALFATAPNGQRFAPDVLVVEEIVVGSGGGQTAVNAFLGLLNGACGCSNDWAAAPYVADSADTGAALFYRTSKVQWISTLSLNTGTGSGSTQPPRDDIRWRVRLVGYNGAGAEMYLYGAHFKAGDASTDQLRRNPECIRLRNDTNALPTNIGGFLLAGDFNIQDSAQLAYQYLVAFGSGFPTNDPRLDPDGRFFDPINRPGNWNNNCTFRNIHTQEPGTGSGGMDDRHDQILISASMRDGEGISYLPAIPTGNILLPFISTPSCTQNVNDTYWYDANHSYRCWGNDGNHFNGAINAGGNNSQVGSTIATNLITTTAGNGHLPVYLDIQVPAKLGTTPSTIDFGTVPIGGVASFNLSITNAGDVTKFSKDGTGWGIDELTYTLTASPGFTAPAGTLTRTATALPPQANVHVITMDTSTSGIKSGTLTIASDDPDLPSRVIVLTGNVGSGVQPPPPGDYDVNASGTVDNDDLSAWFGLFTDVNRSGSVDAADIAALKAYLRWYELADVTHARR